MKRTSAALIPLLMGVLMGFSHPLPASEAAAAPDAQALVAELKGRLALTDAQQASLKPIVEQHAASLKSIRGQYGAEPSRKDKRAMFKAMKDEQAKYQAQVEGVLTPPQQQEWKKIQQEMRAKAKDRYQARGE